MGGSDSLLKKLKSLEDDMAENRLKQAAAEPQRSLIPRELNAAMIKAWAREEFDGLAVHSRRFSLLMRRLIPRIVVFPHELCDEGALVLRGALPLAIGQFRQADTTDYRLFRAF